MNEIIALIIGVVVVIILFDLLERLLRRGDLCIVTDNGGLSGSLEPGYCFEERGERFCSQMRLVSEIKEAA